MCYQIVKLTKMTMKVLIRNKGFIFFVICLPLMATLILNIGEIYSSVEEDGSIIKLSDSESQIAYMMDPMSYTVKVYCAADETLVKNFLEELNEGGLYQIYWIDVKEDSTKRIEDSIRNTAEHDKVGAVIVVNACFEQELLAGKVEKGVQIYKIGEDSRFEIMMNYVEALMTKYATLGGQSENDAKLLASIEKQRENKLQLSNSVIAQEEKLEIFELDVPYSKLGVLGNVVGLMSAAFVFSGIMILGTIIKEKQDLVITRVQLTGTSNGAYMISKFIVIIITALLQTVVTAIAFHYFVKCDTGLDLGQFSLLMFSMSFIFNSISVCVGLCVQSVLTASYLSFIIWMITALLGGSYFDISASSDIYKKVSLLMPQRWGVKISSMFIAENNMAYLVLGVVTFAYLIVILVVGLLGLRLSKKE